MIVYTYPKVSVLTDPLIQQDLTGEQFRSFFNLIVKVSDLDNRADEFRASEVRMVVDQEMLDIFEKVGVVRQEGDGIYSIPGSYYGIEIAEELELL